MSSITPALSSNWFSKLTGFHEGDYAFTQRLLTVDGEQLVSRVNGARHGIGKLELVSLSELRARVPKASGRRSTLEALVGEVRALHRDPALCGALFQAASQFNLLEMALGQSSIGRVGQSSVGADMFRQLRQGTRNALVVSS